MMIINQEELLENAVLNEDKEARKAVLTILEAALHSVDPRVAIRNHVCRTNNLLRIDDTTFDLNKFENIFVVGGGKAGGAMAEALETALGKRLSKGYVNVLRGTKSVFKTQKIFLNEAGHPIPDEDGVKGARKIIQLVSEASENDLVICLISGGGSALMPLPAADITLRDKQMLTDALLRCGATINEINAVRKHISELKGGQLAEAAYPATVVSLILSDVAGDPLDTIASGPTSPDVTTFNDAIIALKKYNLWQSTVPESTKKWLEAGLKGEIPETPKPGDLSLIHISEPTRPY